MGIFRIVKLPKVKMNSSAIKQEQEVLVGVLRLNTPKVLGF